MVVAAVMSEPCSAADPLPDLTAQPDTAARELRKVKKHLRALSSDVTEHLAALDAEMRSPESRERGSRVAMLCNRLDMENDRARYFALGVDYRKDKK
jgi:hypothetical protein